MDAKNITFTAEEWTAGEQQLARYAAGNGRGTLANHFSAYLVLAIRLERILNVLYWWAMVRAGKAEMPEAGLDEWMPKAINSPHGQDWAKQNGLEDAFLAVRACLRNSLNTSRLIATARQAAGLGYWQIAIAAVGLAAVGAGYMWGTDKNEKEAEVKKTAIYGNVAKYLANIDARLLSGQPVPPPPSDIKELANQERSYPWWLLGAGAVLGAAGLFGVMQAVKPTRSAAAPAARQLPAARSNPTRRRAAVKRAPKKRAARKVPPGIKRPRRSNPLKGGYSKATVSSNVAKLVREGRPRGQAAAAALRSARAAWKLKHGKKALPAHLKPKRTAKKAPARKKAAAPKKRAAAKRNPRKGPTPRSRFVATQMRKGRSAKQAAADWKAKQRLKKLRAGKSTRR